MKHLLADLHCKGKPLVEITISLKDKKFINEAIEILNSLGPDIWVCESPYNMHQELPENSRRSLVGQATKESLLKIFGWSLFRKEIPEYLGYFHWEQSNRPQFYPHGLEEKIDFIGFSEPGSYDNGNQDLVEYNLNQ